MQFAELPVYRDIQQMLVQNTTDERVPHAQFFLGADGCGNLAMAIAYAEHLLAGPADMFGNSDARAARLSHPDLHLVFPVVQSKEKIAEGLIPAFSTLIIHS